MDPIYVEDGIADSVNTIGCLRWAVAMAALTPNSIIEIKPCLEITLHNQLIISNHALLIIHGNGATIACSGQLESLLKFSLCEAEIHDLSFDGEYRDMHCITPFSSTLRFYRVSMFDFSSKTRVIQGGAIHADQSKLLLESTTIHHCTGFVGGGIFSTGGSLVVNKSVIHNCKAAGGGAIFTVGCAFSIVGSIMHSNVTDQRGGCLVFESNSGGAITGSLIHHNCVTGMESGPPLKGGGGIYVLNSHLSIYNSTIANNVCKSIGAGIHALLTGVSGSLTIFSSTIANNTNTTMAYGGGGIYADGVVPTITNTLIAANNSAGASHLSPDFICAINGNQVPVRSGGGNVVGVGANGFNQPKDRIGTFASPLNPGITPLANNGGLMMTIALTSTSIAINNGLNKFIPPYMTYDQRGAPFNRINGSAVDTGAFEYN